MGYLDIHHGTQNQSDIAEGILAQVEQGQCHKDDMDRKTHPLEVGFAKQL